MSGDVNSKIRRSAQTLREWQWISTISTDPQTILLNLRREARALIALGLQNPEKAPEIGRIVVAYHRLITAMKATGSHPA